MLLDRSQRNWFLFTLIATIVSIALYILCFHPEWFGSKISLPAWFGMKNQRLHFSVGNTPLGLTYGIVSFAIFLFAALLPLRRKFPLLRIGRIQHWLRGHIWLTTLTLPLVLMHAAFRFGGPQSTVLMWLYLFVMASGFYGLALQQAIPRLMIERLPLETIFEQIPFLTQQLLNAALAMKAKVKAMAEPAIATGIGAPTTPGDIDPSALALTEALEKDILPFLALEKVKGHRLADGRNADEFFRLLKLRVKPDFHERVDQLESWCAERRQMDVQIKYQYWLHSWILFHAPASFLLVALTAWHAIALLVFY